MICLKKRICFFFVIVVLFAHSISFAATKNRDRNGILIVPLATFVGASIGGGIAYSDVTGNSFFDSFNPNKNRNLGLSGLVVFVGTGAGAIVGGLLGYEYYKNNYDDTDISFSKFILGGISAGFITIYIIDKLDLEDSYFAEPVTLIMYIIGARIGANQSPVYIPIANFKF